MTALSRAKAWQADLDPEDLANGCPSVKEDGSPFSADDFAQIAREMRPLASKLAEETNLSQYKAAYDVENKNMKGEFHGISFLRITIRFDVKQQPCCIQTL